MVLDPMYKLEHGSDDAQRGRNVVRTLGELEVGREQYKDDYILNQLARSRFRVGVKKANYSHNNQDVGGYRNECRSSFSPSVCPCIHPDILFQDVIH